MASVPPDSTKQCFLVTLHSTFKESFSAQCMSPQGQMACYVILFRGGNPVFWLVDAREILVMALSFNPIRISRTEALM